MRRGAALRNGLATPGPPQAHLAVMEVSVIERDHLLCLRGRTVHNEVVVAGALDEALGCGQAGRGNASAISSDDMCRVVGTETGDSGRR